MPHSALSSIFANGIRKRRMNQINKSHRSLPGAYLLIGAVTLFLALAGTGCNDNLSHVGGSVMPPKDALYPHADTLHFDAHSVDIDSVYDRSTYSLLGELSDPLYGNLRASYISRFQYARDYHTEFEPIGGAIDSTFIEVSYAKWVGDSTVWSKVTAYEVKQKLPESRYSGDVQPYLKGASYLGALTYRAGNAAGVHKLRIPVSKELGMRFYKASKEHPEYFASQEAFEENLLRGIYLHSTTGNGCMLSVYSTSLVLSYRYQKSDTTRTGADTTYIATAEESFVNTKQLYLHRQFETDRGDVLKKPNSDYAFITSPQGLALSLNVNADELSKTFLKQGSGNTRLINEAALTLAVDPPDVRGSVLQPATYLLLLPADSLGHFFEMGETERSQSNIAFLSSAYNITSRTYVFANISRLIQAHLTKHIHVNDKGVATLDEPLKLIALPVTRETMSGNRNVTATISNYIYPSGARIRLNNGQVRIGVVTTIYAKD